MANDSSRASERKLGELHEKVATVMINALDRAEDRAEREITDEDGNALDTQDVSPALLSAVTKFLKDNEITVQAGVQSGAEKLRERLASKSRRQVGNVVHLADED